MAHFNLTIRTGPAAMIDSIDVAEALEEVADKLRHGNDDEYSPIEARSNKTGQIIDLNGNTVGTWTITEHDH